MKDSKLLGYLNIEYIIDELITGPRPKCTCCGKIILPEDERIILKGQKSRMFFCFHCALETASTVRRLLGYEE